MGKLTPRIIKSARDEAKAWKDKHDALLTVLNAVLLAYGSGPDGRLRVVDHYAGKVRRNVAVEPVSDGILIYLEPVKEDTPHA